jgi:hypothetical protein
VLNQKFEVMAMVERVSRLDEPAAPLERTGIGAASYVDWGAIIAGAIVASAIAFVLLTFGSAVGLTLTSPFRGEGLAGTALAVAIGLWVLWVQVSSFIAGGYLVGRLRRRIPDATEHETEVRDAWHGLVVWGIGTLIGAYLATSAISGVAKAGAEAARTAGTGAVATTAAGAPSTAVSARDPAGYLADKLLRSPTPAANADPEASRAEVARILAASAATGGMSAEDRAYIAQIVAARTGLSQSDAENRLNDLLAKADAAVKTVADRARKIGVLLAFLTAASLFASAAAAWWAAQLGGHHRDQGVELRYFARRR